MAHGQINGFKIEGIAAAVPSNIVSTDSVECLDSTSASLFQKTTGVRERRVADEDLATSDLCFEAAKRLLQDLGWDKSEVGLLIFVSQSPDYYLPASSIILQDRLGLSKDCLSFDVGLGCSGYVYGLSIAGSMMQSHRVTKGLLLAGDISSATCHPNDPATFPLFGDAGTATALSLDGGNIAHFTLHSDGSGYRSIMIPDGGIRNKVSTSSFLPKEYAPGVFRSDLNVSLDGIGVFHFSMKEVAPALQNLLKVAEYEASEIDYVILHQANKLINQNIERKLKWDHAIFPSSIEKFGNTSSASIPLTMLSELRPVLASHHTRLALCGFGVGLSWACGLLMCEPMLCSDLIEIN